MKTLIDKLRKVGRGVKKGVLVATAVASLGVASCKLCPDPEPVNYAPVASLYVNPLSGTAPLPVDIILDGEDENGKEDIVEYSVSIDKGNDGTIEQVITQTSPINTTETINYAGPVNIIGQVKDSQNAINKKEQLINIDNPLIDYLTVEGWLQDNESDTGKQGIVKILDSTGTFIGQTQTDNPNGHFIYQSLDRLVSPFPEEIIIKARMTETDPTSYVRTITANVNPSQEPDVTDFYPNLTGPSFPLEDHKKIRVVPYTGLASDKINDFITHMDRVNFSDLVGINPLPEPGSKYLKKWNHGELPPNVNHPMFQGIEVSSNDFSEIEHNQIKTIIQNSSCPNANSINITRGESHVDGNGWGRIVLGNNSDYNPYNNAPSTIAWDQGQDGHIEGFKTYLTHLQVSEFDINRHEEVGHGILFPGHASEDGVQKLFDSLMVWTSTDNNPKVYDFTATDIKGSYIVDELTYSGMEAKEKILGTTF